MRRGLGAACALAVMAAVPAGCFVAVPHGAAGAHGRAPRAGWQPIRVAAAAAGPRRARPVSARGRPLAMAGREDEDEVRERLEDEIRDNTGAISYVFPRPVRKVVWGAFAANSFWGALVLWTRYAAEGDDADLSNVIGNLETAAVLAALFAYEFWDEGRRKSFRKNLTSRQVEIGDREVYQKVDESTGKVRKYSKLKPVDDDWILRRIDRWGVVETATTGGNPLPTVGPAKGKILEELVAEHKPKLIVDVGSFVGYAAIRMGRRQPEGALTVTIEKDFRWWASASRFVWVRCLCLARASALPP